MAIFDNIIGKGKGPNPMYEKGVLHLEAGKYAEAASAFVKAREVEPGRAEIAYLLGRALAYVGRYQEATEAYIRAQELTPFDIQILHAGAAAFTRLGEYALAVNWYDLILEQENDLQALFLRGECMELSGNFAGAKESYLRILERNPEDLVTWERTGSVLSRLGEDEAAAECYERLLKGDPENLIYLKSAAYAHEKGGNYARAAEQFRKVTG